MANYDENNVYLIDMENRKVLDIFKFKHMESCMKAWRILLPDVELQCFWKEDVRKILNG